MVDRSKSKLLQVWLPRDAHADFEDWLKINSVGANTSERHRQLIYQINAGNLVLKHKAIEDIHARRLEQTLKEQKEARERKKSPITQLSAKAIRAQQIEEGWIYDKQLQCLVKTKAGKYPHIIQ